MPKKLKEAPATITNRYRYNWGPICDGEWWEMTQGVDFVCSIDSFRCVCISYGRRKGYRVHTSKHPSKPGKLAVQFIKLDTQKIIKDKKKEAAE